MAHKKAASSSDNGRDSNPKFLGVKLFGGQHAKAGNIIVRQRGTKYHPGDNVYMGRDHTLHAKVEGHVHFRKKKAGRTFVNIIPLDSDGGAAVKAPTARKAEAKPKQAAAAPSAGKADNLTKIEGIGPKIAEHLNGGGIATFSDLANAPVSKLKEILVAAGPRYKAHIPDTWPQQAQLATDGKWDELQALQDKLDGGRPLASNEEE